MKKPSLSLCMIVRDVERFIGNCLGSVAHHVDEICVVDTGSEDGTISAIRDYLTPPWNSSDWPPNPKVCIEHFTPETNPEAFLLDVPETFAHLEYPPELPVRNFPHAFEPAGPEVYTGKFILADYSAARQKSFDMATSDFIMWIDSDDVVENADEIPGLLAHMVDENLDSMVLDYDYEQDEDEKSVCRLVRTRIIKRGSEARWVHPVHESLGPLGKGEVRRNPSDVRIVHRAHELARQRLVSDASRPPMRNYKILVKHLDDIKKRGETPYPRIWFYLGNECRAWNPERAIEFYDRYTATSEWDEERALAHIYTGQLLEGQGKLEEAEGQYATASVVFPEKPEGHFGLARIAYYHDQINESIRHYEAGRVAIKKNLDVLHYNPYDRNYYPAVVASRAYLARGSLTDLKRVQKVTAEALQVAPQDAYLRSAKTIATGRLVSRRRNLKIIFYLGKSLEVWAPPDINSTGMGGSETAAVHMARNLADRGHNVYVYSDCGDKRGPYDGVYYLPFTELGRHIETLDKTIGTTCDVFISSRRPVTLLEQPSLKARLKVLWMHDNNAGAALPNTSQALLAYDLILTVSEWHREHLRFVYPFLDPVKVVSTRNGVDPARFAADPIKKGNKLIFSSSPERGLAVAVTYLQDVRKQVPDATLHVFYGFNNSDKIIQILRENGRTAVAEKSQREVRDIKQALKEAESDGVVFHGRVGQTELAREMLEAKVLFYPTDFHESSCISAMEAQAAGCTVVSTALAALNETVHHGFLFQPPATSEAYRHGFVNRVVWCLTHEKERARLALEGRQEALKRHDWKGIAEEWEDLLLDRLSSR